MSEKKISHNTFQLAESINFVNGSGVSEKALINPVCKQSDTHFYAHLTHSYTHNNSLHMHTYPHACTHKVVIDKINW